MVPLLMFGLGLFLLWEGSQERQEGARSRGDKVPGHLQEAPALAAPGAPQYLQSSRSCRGKEIPTQEESNDVLWEGKRKRETSANCSPVTQLPLCNLLRVPRNAYTPIFITVCLFTSQNTSSSLPPKCPLNGVSFRTGVVIHTFNPGTQEVEAGGSL